MKTVIVDTLLGGAVLGTISYLSSLYGHLDIYYKILAFLWATPLSFFFFLNMASRHGRNSMVDFTRHAIIGTTFTIVVALIILNLHELMDDQTIVVLSLALALSFTSMYFANKIYSRL